MRNGTITISNAPYFHKLNKGPKVVKEGYAKMVAKFRIGVTPSFG
jgi:hypothetical protein